MLKNVLQIEVLFFFLPPDFPLSLMKSRSNKKAPSGRPPFSIRHLAYHPQPRSVPRVPTHSPPSFPLCLHPVGVKIRSVPYPEVSRTFLPQLIGSTLGTLVNCTLQVDQRPPFYFLGSLIFFLAPPRATVRQSFDWQSLQWPHLCPRPPIIFNPHPSPHSPSGFETEDTKFLFTVPERTCFNLKAVPPFCSFSIQLTELPHPAVRSGPPAIPLSRLLPIVPYEELFLFFLFFVEVAKWMLTHVC